MDGSGYASGDPLSDIESIMTDTEAGQLDPNGSLLDLVEDMDLGLPTSSDDEAPEFVLDDYVARFPENAELLQPIPLAKLRDYWVLFCELDYDGSNQVSASELHESFEMIGIPVDRDELQRMLAETDEDGSGEIDFAEFAHMLYILHKKMLEDPIEERDGRQYLVTDYGKPPAFTQRARLAVWEFMENPASSMGAQLAASIIMFFIIVSCTVFVVESLPSVHKQHDDLFFAIEAVCVGTFTLEYLLRLVSAPNTLHFALLPLSMVDLVAILPFFIELLLASQDNLSGSAMLRVVRLVRVFRLFKMSRYLGWLVAVTETLRQSIMPLGMIVFVFSIGVVVFSSAEYYLERGDWSPELGRYVDDHGVESRFQSIPAAFWWCVITMTTVGYGDVVPHSPLGRFFAAGASLTGVLILAIPISVISANFHTEYAKMMKKRGTSAQHKRDLAAVQASAVQATTDTDAINRSIVSSAATLLHSNSRLMIGNMKHVELSTRGDLVQELMRDVDRTLRGFCPLPNEVPLAK